jgi:hypothetical protein
MQACPIQGVRWAAGSWRGIANIHAVHTNHIFEGLFEPFHQFLRQKGIILFQAADTCKQTAYRPQSLLSKV